MLRILILTMCLLSYGNAWSSEWKTGTLESITKNDKPAPNIPSRITYDTNGRNFGDNLMSFVRGKWLSFNYNIPLLYKPFPYSNQLGLHNEEKKRFSSSQLSKFEDIHEVQNELDVCFEDSSNTLYVVPSFSEPESPYEFETEIPFFEVDWHNKDFRKLLKKDLKPVKEIPPIKFPRGRINVAVYMPQPAESEKEELCQKFPLQYPPDRYYVEQLKKLNQMLYSRPIFVYVFTENRNPTEALKKLQTNVGANNIIYECKKTTRPSKTSAVDDFFNIAKFDCLIRPSCNLGFLIEQFNDFLISIKPIHYKTEKNTIIIDEVHIQVQN